MRFTIFDRIPQTVIWAHNPDPTRTCQTYGKLYCTACGKLLGCTGMYSWRMKREEINENAQEEWISPPRPNGDGRCPKCKVKVAGEGAINGGVNEKEWFES